jgi:dTDP-4-dehydrorhamnose reductase
MKVSVFGASGFMGYDFMRHAMNASHDIELTAYTTSAGNLTNLSRLEVGIELTSYKGLSSLQLASDTDFIINFAHPLSVREVLSTKQQSKRLAEFLCRQLDLIPGVRLIHVSTMSVYEPFSQNQEFGESSEINPPRNDTYADDKALIEEQLLSAGSNSERVLLLRPSIVYGPMGKHWTDNIFMEFLDGDVPHFGLKGRIQPIWVSDTSRFIVERLLAFSPGVLNLAGPETLTWQDFLTVFETIAAKGRLKEITSTIEVDEKQRKSIVGQMKLHLRSMFNHPFARQFVLPLWQRFPKASQDTIKSKLNDSRYAGPGPFCRKFFEEDRLVSMTKFNSQFGDFAFTPIKETIPTMNAYFKFRFEEARLRPH